jgi:hypothetical protein
MVPAANQFGESAYSSLFGFTWALSAPLGAYIVAIGAALTAKVERRVFWLLIPLLPIITVWNILGTTSQMVPALFGIGGGLITLFFIGSTMQWARTRPTLTQAGKKGSDLRMVGSIFFVMAAWNLCGVFGMHNFVLRPELADKFSVLISSTIDGASTVMVLLVLGWGFNFLGQRIAHQQRAVAPVTDKARQMATVK